MKRMTRRQIEHEFERKVFLQAIDDRRPYFEPGTQVITKFVVGVAAWRFTPVFSKANIQARREGRGIILSNAALDPGNPCGRNGIDLWWIKHKDGTVGIYKYDEITERPMRRRRVP